jgi:hypothetical protein
MAHGFLSNNQKHWELLAVEAEAVKCHPSIHPSIRPEEEDKEFTQQ